MAESDVRDIESLEALRMGLLKLGSEWDALIQSIRATIHRADEYFASDRTGYWRRQVQLSERELTQAKDSLSQKRSSVRAADRPAATEAAQRVHRAEARLRTCQDKLSQSRAIALEMSRRCDELLGPLADVSDHCESLLPVAAEELKGLVEHLRRYAEKGNGASPL